MIRLDWLNNLSEEEASTELLKCCGSLNWARQMVSSRPIGSFEELIQKANTVWWNLDRDDWLEAFRGHPKIGENKASAKVSTQSEGWSGQEQAGIHGASTQTLDELAKMNRDTRKNSVSYSLFAPYWKVFRRGCFGNFKSRIGMIWKRNCRLPPVNR
jgi:2-oxo-4-hydroxy-4-carboxy--5-ureidoimidazoline (OHCU) decarboxylase